MARGRRRPGFFVAASAGEGKTQTEVRRVFLALLHNAS